MPISTGYVARETVANLRRNPVMTVAAVVTMAVSLGALGGILIMRQAINKAAVQWRGGVELAIFLNPTVTSNEVAAIGHELSTSPAVKNYHYVDQAQAYQEFKTIFGGDQDLVKVLTVDQMPPSFRVVPVRAGATSDLGNQFNNQPGVLKVSYAQKEIDSLLAHFNDLRNWGLILAVVVMVGAVALIVNTIQLAIFARRREVSVMKLVGATNWFIRVPFMMEGVLDGIVGAVVAFGVAYFFRNSIASFVQNQSAINTGKLYVTSHEALLTGLIVLVVGAVVGAAGSAFAVRRFLQV